MTKLWSNNFRKCFTLLCFAVLFFLNPLYSQRKNLLFQDNFESGHYDTGWRKDWDHPYNGTIVSNPVRAGMYAMKFEWRLSDYDGNNSSKHTELANAPLPAGEQERWYGFSIFLPDSGMKKDSEPEIISQWHQSPDKDEGETWSGAGPPLSLSLQNGNLGINYRWDTRRIIVKGDGVPIKQKSIKLGAAPLNRWIDFVFHIRWDAFGSGLLQVWENDSLVVNEKGISLGYNDKRNAYWKLGIYKYTGKSNYKSRSLYYDEIRIGNQKATYSDVVPEKKNPLTARWQRGKLLYRDDFDKSLKNWIAELENSDNSSVNIKNGQLEAAIIKGGATIWFKPELSGNILIEYEATVVSHSSNGANLNQFWMASDPVTGNKLFSRKGKFSEYDNLMLYYGGLGGNENTTSRFRKYLADGTKPVLQEYTDPAHFPVAGKTYSIQIIVYDGLTRLTVDGQNYFELNDPNPYTKGHFAFRTFQSKIKYDNFKVYRLEAIKEKKE